MALIICNHDNKRPKIYDSVVLIGNSASSSLAALRWVVMGSCLVMECALCSKFHSRNVYPVTMSPILIRRENYTMLRIFERSIFGKSSFVTFTCIITFLYCTYKKHLNLKNRFKILQHLNTIIITKEINISVSRFNNFWFNN